MRTIVIWVLSSLLAIAFIGAGLAKLTAQPMMVAEFAGFGYPAALMYLTGVLELVGVALILTPRVAYLGAALFVCIMVGALFSHLTHGQAAMAAAPFVLLVLAIAVGTLRNWGRGPALTVRQA